MSYPKHPCRLLETRACPKSYDGPCPQDECARFESDDETPWADDLIEWQRNQERRDRDG